MIVQRTQEGKAVARQNPDFLEGRPKKHKLTQIKHAMDLLEDYSYKQVEAITEISVSTLVRARRKGRDGEQSASQSKVHPLSAIIVGRGILF